MVNISNKLGLKLIHIFISLRVSHKVTSEVSCKIDVRIARVLQSQISSILRNEIIYSRLLR